MNSIDIINTPIFINDATLCYLRDLGQHDITTDLIISDTIVNDGNTSLLVSSVMFNEQNQVIKNHTSSALMSALVAPLGHASCTCVAGTSAMNIIKDYLNRFGLSGGYVLTLRGSAYSWKREIFHGESAISEPPGVVAISQDGSEIFQAIGGNKIDGAERWDCVYFSKK